MNYDTSNIGVPYAKVNLLQVTWPDTVSGLPTATIGQVNCVVLADGTTRNLEPLPTLTATLDFANDAFTPIPLVDHITGAPTGQTTSLAEAFNHVLAVVRSIQTKG